MMAEEGGVVEDTGIGQEGGVVNNPGMSGVETSAMDRHQGE